MTHPGEQFYPDGVHWDDPLNRGSLSDLLSAAAAQYGARPAIEFRDRAISYAGLEELAEVAASAFLRAGYGPTIRSRCFSAIRPIIPSIFSAR
jgi:long-chain acyl-CoA synthetase